MKAVKRFTLGLSQGAAVMVEHPDGDYVKLSDVQDLFRGPRWQVVPTEPTPEMLDAFNEWAQCMGFKDKGYEAMLRVAKLAQEGKPI